MAEERYAVEVWRNGESVVRIETNCLGGREISPEDEQAIRDAAHSLLGFIGDPHPTHLRLAREVVAAAENVRNGIYFYEHGNREKELAAALSAYRSATASMEKNDGL